MKKLLFVFVAVAAISLFFVACKDKETGGSNVIEAKNVLNSSAEIVNVEANAYYYSDEGYILEKIASCKYEKNGFKLTLPKVLDAKYLFNFWDDEDIQYPDITISDKNAKTAEIEILALDNTGEKCGSFFMLRSDENEYKDGEVIYLYADRNFTVKGKYEVIEEDEEEGITYSSIANFNCSFKKGWNILYTTYDISINLPEIVVKIKATTEKPSGINWVWSYGSWYGIEKTPKHNIKSIHNFKKNFLRK